MRVLVACEYSGVVRDALIARGVEAVSCDLLPTEQPGPHIQGDVLAHFGDGWDMMNRVRMMAIDRYLRQCLCGKDARDVHHTNYERKGFERPEDVVALCRECHTRWHETWVLQAKAGLEAA